MARHKALAPIGVTAEALDAQIRGGERLTHVPVNAERQGKIARLLAMASRNCEHIAFRTVTLAALFGRDVVVQYQGKPYRVTFWRNRPYLFGREQVPE